jgi:hypothetical protein
VAEDPGSQKTNARTGGTRMANVTPDPLYKDQGFPPAAERQNGLAVNSSERESAYAKKRFGRGNRSESFFMNGNHWWGRCAGAGFRAGATNRPPNRWLTIRPVIIGGVTWATFTGLVVLLYRCRPESSPLKWPPSPTGDRPFGPGAFYSGQ